MYVFRPFINLRTKITGQTYLRKKYFRKYIEVFQYTTWPSSERNISMTYDIISDKKSILRNIFMGQTYFKKKTFLAQTVKYRFLIGQFLYVLVI